MRSALLTSSPVAPSILPERVHAPGAPCPHSSMPVFVGRRVRWSLLRAVLVGMLAAGALSGCGVFCGGAGGSGGGFAGACATGMRF